MLSTSHVPEIRTLRLAPPRGLLLIVLVAIAVRMLALWVGRSEFTGWLSHAPYSFVQVRALLEQGSLAYADMPLLFLLDALVARGLMALGVGAETAIVSAARLVTCLAPALIAVPVHGIVRTVAGAPLRRGQWALVAIAAFLPLSVAYLPEYLQKNLLGLLLLSVVVRCSQRLLLRPAPRDAIGAAVFSLLLVLTHFGTSCALVLYGVAVLLAGVIVERSVRRLLFPAALLLIGSGVTLALVFAFDARRFQRVVLYATESLDNSLVAALFSSTRGGAEVAASLAAILILYVLLFLLSRLPLRPDSELTPGERTFWLANALYCGLLILPVLDERLMGRLALFASLPLLVVFVHVEQHAMRPGRLRTVIVALVAGLVLLMATGEVVGVRVRNARDAAVLEEMRALAAEHPLGAADLVLTRTGAEHACNWFHRVQAGTITSLELEDFERHDRVYVLNPAVGTMSLDGVRGRTATSEPDRYLFMRTNIPRPTGIEPVFAGEHLELFRLSEPPSEWRFGEDGRFLSYAR